MVIFFPKWRQKAGTVKSGLADRFGFFENQERASLNISKGIDFDAVINTAKGNPATLANEFLEKLEKSKISPEHVSTL